MSFKMLGVHGIGSSHITFIVEKATAENGTTIYNSINDILHEIDSARILDINPGNPEYGIFSLHVKRPLRLQVGGRISQLPTFKDIIAALSRRITLLSYFHCGGDGNPIASHFLKKIDTEPLAKVIKSVIFEKMK